MSDANAQSNKEQARLYWELVNEALRREADLHWQRNSHFLVVASILLLALSQFRSRFVQVLLSILGLVLSAAWLLITWRSSEYVKLWKREDRLVSQKLSQPSIYPKDVPGVEMRNIAYVLPLVFLLLWFVLMASMATGAFGDP